MFIAGRSNTIEKSEESKPTSSLFGNSTLRKSFASVATPVSKLKASVARTVGYLEVCTKFTLNANSVIM